MNDVNDRLIKCFSIVFPELTKEEIVQATADRTDKWDSLSWVTLLAVVQEEFKIELDVEDAESSTSFERILAQVTEAVRPATPVE